MAEGSVEEESGEMLGPTVAHPTLNPASCNPPYKQEDQESDCESSVGSPEPASAMGIDGSTDLSMGPRLNNHCRPEDGPNSDQKHPSPVTQPAHLNGTMAGLVTLQNLQNLATLQQTLPQLAAGLQNMTGLPSPMVNAPLNLSLNASIPAVAPVSSTSTSTSTAPRSQSTGVCTSDHSPHSSSVAAMTSVPPNPNATANCQSSHPNVPGSGMTGLGAQPPSMPQLILASGQLVQGIQGAQLLIPTSQGLATQTILTIPVNHVNSTDQMVNLALNNGQVVTTSLANLQAMAQTNLLSNPSSAVPPTTTASLPHPLLPPSTLSHLLSNGHAQQLLQSLPPILPPPVCPPQPPNQSAPHLNLPPAHQPPRVPPQPNQTQQHQHQHQHYAPPQDKRPLSRSPSSPPSTNGELQINTQGVKMSPSSSLSPGGCGDSSTADLLIDSPNQPTINQTNSNVVDGINLDEIKDFAKAFKLRRLSLGLTQTQVGQALSVTEGPAYSQSAICSALASQMFAAAQAQLSSQQQAMFEKLDITPKSAQKIKPVLERWMKEAEDRYKSGQNHLTDFIGIEPSKKRKRRTSFTPQALELLNAHFERNTHPSGTEITGLAHQLGYEREVIRIWFCNKRQALKNTVRMMSKGMV